MNTHLKIAIGIAPFLLIGGWIAADYWDNAKQQPPQEIALTLKAPCHLSRNRCVLESAQLSLQLQSENSAEGTRVRLLANQPLKGVLLEVVHPARGSSPLSMAAVGSPQRWRVTLPHNALPVDPPVTLRLACQTSHSRCYAEFEAD